MGRIPLEKWADMKRLMALGGVILVSLGLTSPVLAARSGSDSSGTNSYSLTCVRGVPTFRNTSPRNAIQVRDGNARLRYSLPARDTGRFTWTNGWEVRSRIAPGPNGWYPFDAGDETPRDICPIAAPSAPRAVKATPANHSVRLSWAAPASNGRAAITDYTIQRRQGTRPWVTIPDGKSTARSYRVTRLTNGTRYQFRVIARNTRWSGAASAVVRATPRTVPSAPRALEAQSANQRVRLSWRAPASNGGAPVIRYTVQRRANRGWITIRRTTERSLRVAGLHNGTRYHFRVAAGNAAGKGAWSRTASVIPHGITSHR